MQRAFTAIKEHSSVAYAKAATIGGFCDLSLIIVKATSPDDFPPPERYVNELLKIFSISPSSFRSFSLSFTRRFSKTQCWRVALKSLILLHRLLRSLPEHSPFRTELLQTRSNGTLCLYPCRFRDSSSSFKDYTIFVRSYAHLLDEALDYFSLDEEEEEEEEKHYEEEEEPKNLQEKMKEVGRLLELLPQLQSLIDRVMGCKPSSSATQNLLVRTAMRLVIRESFVCYTSFRKEVVVLLENLLQMPYRNCIAAFGIYKKASLQASQLSHFYEWCKFMGLCGPYESPIIDQIPEIQVQALETFLNGMWQLTDIESSSSSSSPSSITNTTAESPQTSLLDSSSSTSAEDNSEKQEKRLEVVVSNQWVKFEESPLPEKSEMDDQEVGPLIQLDDDDDNDNDDNEAIININDSWEVILEASIGSQSFTHSTNNLFFNPNIEHGYGWEMQLYNPHALNPFHQPHSISLDSAK